MAIAPPTINNCFILDIIMIKNNNKYYRIKVLSFIFWKDPYSFKKLDFIDKGSILFLGKKNKLSQYREWVLNIKKITILKLRFISFSNKKELS